MGEVRPRKQEAIQLSYDKLARWAGIEEPANIEPEEAPEPEVDPAQPEPKNRRDTFLSKWLKSGAEQWADYETKAHEMFSYNADHTPPVRGTPRQAQQQSERQPERKPEPQQIKADNDDWIVANSTEMKALELAYSEQLKYRDINNRQPKTAVQEYRHKLAELMTEFKPDKVAENYHKNTDKCMYYEKVIRDYLRAKGFSAREATQAMRTASPATYKKSQAIALRYARRFNEYLRSKRQQLEQSQKQERQLKIEQQQKQNKGRGRSR